MYLQMKAYVRMEFQEKLQQLFCTARIVVEGPVEDTYIFYTVAVNNLKAFADTFDGQCAYRFFSTADTECACVETAPGCLQLYEWLVPVEEATSFRRHQS